MNLNEFSESGQWHSYQQRYHLFDSRYIPSNDDRVHISITTSGWVSIAVDFTEWIPIHR